MKNKMLPLLLLAAALPVAFGCAAAGPGGPREASAAKKTNALDATEVCKLLDDPVFENRSPYDGFSCSGSSSFGGKPAAGTPAENVKRPSLVFLVYGDETNAASRINLTMLNREDAAGLEFFVTEAQAIAKMINGQRLPPEIEAAIKSSYVMPGSMDARGSWKIGDANVTLVRSTALNPQYKTDAKIDLNFEFPNVAGNAQPGAAVFKITD